MLYLRVQAREATKEKVHAVDLDYPLFYHARTFLRIGLEFIEPVDNNIPIDEERQLWNSDFEFEDNNDVDPDLGDKDLGPGVDDTMDEV